MADTLSDRLNRIIDEQKVTKREFARRVGVGENYIYVLTRGGRGPNLNQNISPTLAKVIGAEFGYDPEWILNGEISGGTVEKLRQATLEQVEKLSLEELLELKEFLQSMNKSKSNDV